MAHAATETYQTLKAHPTQSGFGAQITGVDLSKPLVPETMAEMKVAWARHGVLSFPGQPLTLDQLEAFTLQMGGFGHDPYIAPMPGHPNVLELRREPDEKATNFGGGWHSDWSFQDTPPAATILRAEVTPPVGGDTLFADCARAYEDLSDNMKLMLAPMQAIHSARRPYGSKGSFAQETEKRTMKILTSAEADKSRTHPLVRTHPVTGRKALYVSPTYTVGIEGFTEGESNAILGYLFSHITQPHYIFRHKWAAGTLLMWDNRCTVHFAEGGYDGHLRLMHRTTVAGDAPV